MKKTPKLDANGKRKFGIRDKLAYAAGDLGCNLSFGLKSTVQTFWLVFMFMETGLFSILLLIVQAWDAINDPLIGSLIDNDKRKYKLGKYKTYILIGALGLLVGERLYSSPSPMLPLLSRRYSSLSVTSFGMRRTPWQTFPTELCLTSLPRTQARERSFLYSVPSAALSAA